jgi:hypothetical protein
VAWCFGSPPSAYFFIRPEKECELDKQKQEEQRA